MDPENGGGKKLSRCAKCAQYQSQRGGIGHLRRATLDMYELEVQQGYDVAGITALGEKLFPRIEIT